MTLEVAGGIVTIEGIRFDLEVLGGVLRDPPKGLFSVTKVDGNLVFSRHDTIEAAQIYFETAGK